MSLFQFSNVFCTLLDILNYICIIQLVTAIQNKPFILVSFDNVASTLLLMWTGLNVYDVTAI